ncbi:MAG: hypothetical protein JXR40_07925 [Pontiellaceae bacterium]|nr:hypothetical protein [Pontiellaceae bacterium]
MFNYEIQSNYTIRVQSTDQGLLFTEKAFSITATYRIEPPQIMQTPDVLLDGKVVIHWSSITNHAYTVYDSTNLLTGFAAVQSNIPATPPINSFTNSAMTAPQKFWEVSTGP